LATLRRIQEQLTELKDSSTFNRQGSGFSAGAAGLPPGVVKPRKIEARLDALRTLKSQGVPHGDALVLYYDVPEQTIRKIIQLTVYLWMVNITSSPVWIEPETYLFLERAYNTIDIDVSKCSGLALMLYASRKNAKRAGAYTKDLGKTYITMVAQVALGIFGACRQDLFRNDSPVHPYFTRPKWGRRVDDPPRFLRADFITGLVKSSEYDFTRMIVWNLRLEKAVPRSAVKLIYTGIVSQLNSMTPIDIIAPRPCSTVPISLIAQMPSVILIRRCATGSTRVEARSETLCTDSSSS